MKIHTLDLDFLDIHQAIAVFVVEGPSGIALIETGPYATYPHLQEALKNAGFKMAGIQQVFLSHIHFDHAGAAWAFAETGAHIYVHPKGLPHLAAPEKLYNSARMIYGDDMDRLWGAMNPIPETQLTAPDHGEQFQAAGLTFTAWYTPGHAVHHIAWEVGSPDAASILFTGDVAGVKIGNGPVMPPCPPPDINVEDWQSSIQLMREHRAETLYLTHFGPIFDKRDHLDRLESQLLDWANWMKPHFEAGTLPEIIVPQFQDYVNKQLSAAGLDKGALQRYEAANPAFMSVAGLLRYWKKKTV